MKKQKLGELLRELAKKDYSEDIIVDCILLPAIAKDKWEAIEQLIQMTRKSSTEKELQQLMSKIETIEN